MDFHNFCTDHFNGNEQQAIQQLAFEGYHREYRFVENEGTLKTILDSMTKEQAKTYMAEFRHLVRENSKKQTSGGMKSWGAVVLAVFFLLAAVGTFITGYTNIAKRNELKQTGVLVEITVVDEEYDSVNENTTYTFSYTIDGNEYTFVDWPGRDYDIGDTFKEYIDPDQPQILVLASSNLFFSFWLLGFAVFSLLLSDQFRWLTKYLAYIIMIWAAGMAAVGIMLDALGFTITGSVILLAATIVWLNKRKQQKAA